MAGGNDDRNLSPATLASPSTAPRRQPSDATDAESDVSAPSTPPPPPPPPLSPSAPPTPTSTPTPTQPSQQRQPALVRAATPHGGAGGSVLYEGGGAGGVVPTLTSSTSTPSTPSCPSYPGGLARRHPPSRLKPYRPVPPPSLAEGHPLRHRGPSPGVSLLRTVRGQSGVCTIIRVASTSSYSINISSSYSSSSSSSSRSRTLLRVVAAWTSCLRKVRVATRSVWKWASQ